MNIIILLLTFLSIVAPTPNAECTSDWMLLWEVQDCRYCNGQDSYGDYSLFACETIKSSESLGEYTTLMFESQCVYAAGIELPPAEEVFVSFLPVVTTGCPEGSWLDNGSCVILGIPVVAP